MAAQSITSTIRAVSASTTPPSTPTKALPPPPCSPPIAPSPTPTSGAHPCTCGSATAGPLAWTRRPSPVICVCCALDSARCGAHPANCLLCIYNDLQIPAYQKENRLYGCSQLVDTGDR